jgi:Uma2 family endonuclease
VVETPSKTRFTFDEYLTYDDGTDKRYELVNGELVEMNPPTGLHARIIRYLFKQLDGEIERLGREWIVTWDYGIRTTENKSRLPDLVVITAEQEQSLLNVSAVLQEAPLLAVEIVSQNEPARDYRYKRSDTVLI